MHSLAVTEQGTEVHVQGDTLVLQRGGKSARTVRLQELREVLLFGRVEVTSAAVAVLARRGIDLVWLTAYGYYRARLLARGSRNVELRLAQFRRLGDPEFVSRVARSIVAGKILHQRALLLRVQRKLRDEGLAEALGRMRLLAERAAREADLDRLRGLEGEAAAVYFGQFDKAVDAPEMPFRGRSRRPPRDPVNACLSFGYALLGSISETELLRCGLDPMAGFFHAPKYGRPSLMLDLIEEFRPFVDALVLRLIHRRQLGPGDFVRRGEETLEEILAEDEPAGEGGDPVAPRDGAANGGAVEPGVFLGDAGRKVFLGEFFRRMRERLYYPPRDAAFELRDVLREQAYHLARVIEGKDAEYATFVPR